MSGIPGYRNGCALLGGVLTLAAALLVATPVDPAAASGCNHADGMPREITPEQAAQAVRCLIDDTRRDHGRRELAGRNSLDTAARRHTEHMKSDHCFSHECPGEAGLVGRITATSYLPCSCSWGVAENIAWGSEPRGTPHAIVKAWMHSAGHRANILNGAYQHIGVGVEWGSPQDPSATAGIYTTDFGYKR